MYFGFGPLLLMQSKQMPRVGEKFVRALHSEGVRSPLLSLGMVTMS